MLPVEPSPDSVERDLPKTLRLTTVLHAPSFLCNILGGPILHDHYFNSESHKGTKGYLADKKGRHVACFDPNRPLWQLKLRGPPVGYHALEPDGFYVINAGWSDSERAKWHAHQKILAGSLSMEEKTWLKMYFGNEFHFLQAHGLSIYDDGDRDEGRSILRALMPVGKE